MTPLKIRAELHVLRDILMHKYGREFALAVVENNCVSQRVRVRNDSSDLDCFNKLLLNTTCVDREQGHFCYSRRGARGRVLGGDRQRIWPCLAAS